MCVKCLHRHTWHSFGWGKRQVDAKKTRKMRIGEGREEGGKEEGKEGKGDSCILLRSLHWTVRIKAL